jgi:GH24 family phage-related lysozyme (muramidase)
MSLANAKVRAIAMIAKGEAFINWMYLDSLSYVTIGYGTMLPDADAAVGVDLRHPNKRLATADEKRAEWRRLRAISPAGAERNYSAQSYRKDATLFIMESEADRLRLLKLDGFIVDLRNLYPRFDTFPEDAQVALMDMVYNLGPTKLRKQFKNFGRAINNPKGPDWKRAALESNRPQLSAERNKDVKDLFLSAARIAEIEARNQPGRPPAGPVRK